MDCSYRNLQNIPELSYNLTTTLDLSYNNLTRLTGSPFGKLSQLEWLDLSFNNISSVSSAAFNGLYTLKTLLVMNNSLLSLPDDVFSDLSQLIKLDMQMAFGWSQNEIPSRAIALLRSIQDLVVTGINFTSLYVDEDFQNLTSLRHLDIGTMNLVTLVTNETFQHLAGLPIEEVTLAWFWRDDFDNIGKFEVGPSALSPFTHVRTLSTIFVIHNLSTIESINSSLESLMLNKLKVNGKDLLILNETSLQVLWKWNTSLIELAIQTFQLQGVFDYSFSWTPRLFRLNMNNNQIKYVSEDAFHDLSSLEVLELGSNFLQSVSSQTFAPFAVSNCLRFLDLSFNLMSDSITLSTFSHAPSLDHLDLSGNKMLLPSNWKTSFYNLSEIILDGVFDFSFEFGGTIWSDDPILSVKTLQYKDIGSLRFRTKMCFMLPNLERAFLSRANIDESIAVLDLSKCRYLQELDLSGSMRITGSEPITSVLNLEYLNMGSNDLSSTNQLMFLKAPLLTTLDLSNNKIQDISEEISVAYPNLVSLNLEGNIIVTIEGLRKQNLLRNLNLARNQMTTIPVWLFEANSFLLDSLDLSQNPFQCSCLVQPFRNWILVNRQTRLLNNLYACASPTVLKGMSILEIELDCSSRIGLYLGIALPLSFLVFTGIFLIAKYRWHIKYKLFLIYRHYNHIPGNNNDFEMVGNMEYHAYIAYDDESVEDENWVLDELQPNIENEPDQLRLCIKRRDFIPGRPIIDAIYENIQRSFKTIAILTPDCMDSEWCHYEIEMAKMRLFQENRDVLILVLLKDIPGNKITMSLRQLLCKKQYLVWPHDRAGQRLFWDRLKAEIREPVQKDRRYDV